MVPGRILPKCIAVAGGFMMLSGCVATNCTNDPLTDNVGCAARNLSTGVYDAQTEQLSQQATSKEAAAADARSVSERSQTELNATRQQRRALEGRVSSARTSLIALRRSVANAQANQQIGQAQATIYDQRMSGIEARLDTSETEADIRALEAEIESLRMIISDVA